MPLFLDTCGFELRDLAGDQILGGVASWATHTPPGLSARAVQVSTTPRWRLWRASPAAGFVLVCAWKADNNTQAQQRTYGASDAAGEVIGWGQAAGGALTLRVGGVVVATSEVVPDVLVWHRVRVEVEGLAEGDAVRLYLNGELATSHTLTEGEAAGLGAPDRWHWMGGANAGWSHLDDMAALDLAEIPPGRTPADYATLTIGLRTLTGAGERQEGAGAYTAIDEVPFNGADKVVFDAPGEGADYQVQVHPGAAYQVLAVVQTAGVQRVGTGAGEQLRPYLREDGASRFGAAVAAPVDGVVEWAWEATRDDTAWADTPPADFNAHTFGVETVT